MANLRGADDNAISTVSQAPDNESVFYGPKRQRRRFILCFDGTGNKFQGNEGDSNILKIYSMLDKTDGSQFHYYQPGIGTYTTRSSLSSNSMISRLSSWYHKAKDAAEGTTVDEHVMAGYKFLMKYYHTDDDMYLFGFSRGSYVARFLAEILDHVGLLSAGNEELIRFVWKTFAKWQERQGGESSEERKKAAEMLKFMTAFRETFSRPVRRIRFLGLFDTVNSVSKFESAWMARSKKFPYTARSSALIIRHAVSIDERRAKFRQDLLSQKIERDVSCTAEGDEHCAVNGSDTLHSNARNGKDNEEIQTSKRFKKLRRNKGLSVPSGFGSDRYRSRSRGRSRASLQIDKDKRSHIGSNRSTQMSINNNIDYDSDDEDAGQDIQEVWFPGGHADIGGGWPPDEAERLTLSHGPLVWMVREAQKSGMTFISEKMKALNCFLDEDADNDTPMNLLFVPQIEVNDNITQGEAASKNDNAAETKISDDSKKFLDMLESCCTRGQIHDCLSFNQGLPASSVVSWRLMEYLPFRRMDLQKDGTWKAIRWPLPMGEVRDIPDNAIIHNSVMRRMKADPNYRPGNLIVGGGGRGKRKAPKELGMGDWVLSAEKGHPVGEVWIKRKCDDGKNEMVDEKEVEKDRDARVG